MTEHEGLPVPGYKPQNDMRVALVTANKLLEEKTLRVLDDLARAGNVDLRWMAIGRTDIEKGWMAVNRSIFQPGRATLPDDGEPNGLELAAQWHEAQAAEYEQKGTDADMAQAEAHRGYARAVRDIDAGTAPDAPVPAAPPIEPPAPQTAAVQVPDAPSGAPPRFVPVPVTLTADVTTPTGGVMQAGLEGEVVNHPQTVPGGEADKLGLVAIRFHHGGPTYLIPRIKTNLPPIDQGETPPTPKD